MTSYAFPETIPAFSAALPFAALGPGVSEVEFEFGRSENRSYPPEMETMRAATYTAAFSLAPSGTISFGVLKHSNTGKVIQSVSLIARAFAQYYAYFYAYASAHIPLPENPGIMSPYSGHSFDTLDGTARFRGVAGGIHSLDPDLVATVDLTFEAVWIDGGA